MYASHAGRRSQSPVPRASSPADVAGQQRRGSSMPSILGGGLGGNRPGASSAFSTPMAADGVRGSSAAAADAEHAVLRGGTFQHLSQQLREQQLGALLQQLHQQSREYPQQQQQLGQQQQQQQQQMGQQQQQQEEEGQPSPVEQLLNGADPVTNPASRSPFTVMSCVYQKLPPNTKPSLPPSPPCHQALPPKSASRNPFQVTPFACHICHHHQALPAVLSWDYLLLLHPSYLFCKAAIAAITPRNCVAFGSCFLLG